MRYVLKFTRGYYRYLTVIGFLCPKMIRFFRQSILEFCLPQKGVSANVTLLRWRRQRTYIFRICSDPTDQNSRTGSEQMRNIYVLAKFWSNFSPLKSQVPGATTLPNAQCRLTRACKTRAATWLPRAATWLPRDATWLPRDATWLPRLPASGCVRRATCAWVLACFLLLAAAACGRHRHYHTGRRCTRSVT